MKQLSRSQEHRRVHIMTTGVHHAINCALMLPLHQFLTSQVHIQQNVIIAENNFLIPDSKQQPHGTAFKSSKHDQHVSTAT
jgi:hypothetical protein